MKGHTYAGKRKLINAQANERRYFVFAPFWSNLKNADSLRLFQTMEASQKGKLYRKLRNQSPRGHVQRRLLVAQARFNRWG